MKPIFLIFHFLPLVLSAQKHDQVWLSGRKTSATVQTKGFRLNFNQAPLVQPEFRDMSLTVVNSSICDTSGQLQFCTNGCDIAGNDNQIIENGDGLNPGEVHTIQCDDNLFSYTAGIQSSVILPWPGKMGQYALFHKRIIYKFSPFRVISDVMFLSTVDMQLNNGKGKVISKNIPIMETNLAFGEISAVKHANGRDWWLISPGEFGGDMYVFLFDERGIVDTLKQPSPLVITEKSKGGGQWTYTPDGELLIYYNPLTDIQLFDFDRTSGQLSNYRKIKVNYISLQPEPGRAGGCAVSPNGRYLYATMLYDLYQFDLEASDISASQELVGVYDGYADPFPSYFAYLQLGPDCKIYGMTGQETKRLHIIHNPDGRSKDCGLEQHGLVLPYQNGGSMPTFPNYRLGPLDNPGVPCKSTVGIGEMNKVEGAGLKVYPNPVSDQIILDYSHLPIDRKSVFTLFDHLGRTVKVVELSASTDRQIVMTGTLPNGVYYYSVPGLGSGKLIVHHN